MADDPLISQSEQAEAEADAERAAKAARLFDIRRLIGGLFLIYGVILTVLGLGESDASIAKSADINVNLYAGIGMLIMSACFIAWALWRPLGEDEEASEPAGGGSGGDGDDAVGARAAGGEQRQHRAAEPPAHHPRAGRAGALEAIDGRLDLGHRRLEIVAQAGVRGVEQLPDRPEIARVQRRHRRLDPLVLVQHVSRPLALGAAEAPRRLRVGVAQVLDAERLRRGAALRAALVVAALGMRVGRARVGGDELPAAQLERHGLQVERLEVDPQRAALLTEQRCELVEQAGLGADPVVLHARAQLRQLDAVRLARAGDAEQREAQRRLERGRGAEARAARHVGLDHQPGGSELDAGGGQLRHRAAHERAPAVGAAGVGEREIVGLGEVEGDHLHAVAAQRLGGHRHAAVDRERKREPPGVIGVLADQVDAAGAARADATTSRDRRRRRRRDAGAASGAWVALEAWGWEWRPAGARRSAPGWPPAPARAARAAASGSPWPAASWSPA